MNFLVLKLNERIRFFAVLTVFLCFLFSANVSFSQNAPGNPHYYDNLMDSLFRDVKNIVQLGMDYALNNQKRIDSDFAEWLTGHDKKDPEQKDYLQAVLTLHDGWESLLQSAKIYHEMRQRKNNDAVTQKMYQQAEQLRREGVAKVKETNSLRQSADDKRDARLKAEREKAEQEKMADRERNADKAKSLSEGFEKLNEEEQAENEKYNSQIAKAASEPNLQKRQSLIKTENARHEKQINDIDKRRDELGKKLDSQINEQTKNGKSDISQEYFPPDLTNSEMNGDVCFIPPPKKFEGCGGTMQSEYTRWQQEIAANNKDFKAENARHYRRLESLNKGRSQPDLVRKEIECHQKRIEQIDEQSNRLQERHLKCFNQLNTQNGRKP